MQPICKQKVACPTHHAAWVCLFIALTSFSCPNFRQPRGVLKWPVVGANRKPEYHTHFHNKARNEE